MPSSKPLTSNGKMWAKISHFTKIEHTAFSLPLLFAGAWIGTQGQMPSLIKLFLIIINSFLFFKNHYLFCFQATRNEMYVRIHRRVGEDRYLSEREISQWTDRIYRMLALNARLGVIITRIWFIWNTNFESYMYIRSI